jgi:hypothetical protein
MKKTSKVPAPVKKGWKYDFPAIKKNSVKKLGKRKPSEINSIRSCASYFGKKLKRTYAVRVLANGMVNVYRVK